MKRSAAAACVVAAATVWPAAARTTGVLSGTVRDVEGRPIVGAAVTIASPAMLGGPRSARSAEDGGYRFPSLPPGDYDLSARAPGCEELVHRGITVRMDAATVFDPVLQLEHLQVEVEVQGRESLVEPEKASTATVLDRDLLEVLPILGRGYQRYLAIAPGVAAEHDHPEFPNVRGARETANVYLFDGANTTDTSSQRWGSFLSPDAIEQVELLTGGYPAEFGRALGAVVNIRTKSGGNDLEGSFRFDFRDKALDKYGSGKQAFDADGSEYEYRYYSATLGGPIRRDRAWFFVSAFLKDQTSVYVDEDAAFPVSTTTDEHRDLFAKVSYQVGDDHQLVLSYHDEPQVIHGSNAFGSVSPEYYSQYERHGHHLYAREEAVLSPTLLLESLVLVTDDREERILPDEDAPPSSVPFGGFEVTDQTFVGSYPEHVKVNHDRNLFRQDLSWYLPDSAGTHDLKLGWSYELEMSAYQGRSEPWYDLRNGVPTRRHTFGFDPRFDTTTSTHMRVFSLYAQDAWSPRPGLTLNLGLRADLAQMEFGGVGNLERVTDPQFQRSDRTRVMKQLDGTGVSPRLGFAWDVGGDGKSVLRGGLARYYQPWEGALGGAERSGLAFTEFICKTDAQGNCVNEPEDVSYQFVVDPDVQFPYTDELTLGYEREVGAEMSAGATVVLRRGRDLLQDRNINIRYFDVDGDGFPESREKLNENFTPVFFIENGDRSDYRGLELSFRRRYAARWQLLASYTYSVAKGDGETTYGATGEDPRLADAEYSWLDYDQRHIVKVDGSYLAPWGVLVSASARYYSGTPYSIWVTNWKDANGNGWFDVGEDEGFGGHWVGPRNAYRNEPYFNLDLLLEKEFSFRGVGLGVFGNVLNVLNDQSVTSTTAGVVPYDEDCDPSKRDCYPPNYVKITEGRRFGRQFQLGFRITFGGATSRSRSVASTPSPRTSRSEPAPEAVPTKVPPPVEELPKTASPEPPAARPASAPAPPPPRASAPRVKGRTVVGKIVALDERQKRIHVETGLDRVVVLSYDDATKVKGGKLAVGAKVRASFTIESRATWVATRIKILD